MSARLILVLTAFVVAPAAVVVAQALLLLGAGRSGAVSAQLSALNTGDIVIRLSGSCGVGFTEVTELSGRFLLGTLAANLDQGGTGGADSVTPTVASLTAAAQTISGNVANESTHTHSVTSNVTVADHASHTHTYTQVPNHVHVYASQTATTGSVSSYEHGAIDTSSTAAEASISTNNPTGGVATGTTAGPSAALSHSPTNNAVTSGAGEAHGHGAGTLVTSPSAVTGTLNAVENRPAFTKVIFCQRL